MANGLINLTFPAVIREIEDVLDDYPEHPYQLAFSLPELRQKLIDHIFNHAPNGHPEEKRQIAGNPIDRPSSLLQERLRLGMIVRGSILHILRENADWLSHNLP